MYQNFSLRTILTLLAVFLLAAVLVFGPPLVYEFYTRDQDRRENIPIIDTDVDALCEDWPETDRPTNFPASMSKYQYAGMAVFGSMELVKGNDGKTWMSIVFSQLPQPPSEARPFLPFEEYRISIAVDQVYSAYPEVVVSDGPITAWMAVSYEYGVSIVIELPSGDAFDTQISDIPVFRLPCMPADV